MIRNNPVSDERVVQSRAAVEVTGVNSSRRLNFFGGTGNIKKKWGLRSLFGRDLCFLQQSFSTRHHQC